MLTIRVTGYCLRVIVIMSHGMRSRSHQGHFSAHHVHKLRQFIDAGSTQHPADPRHPQIVFYRLYNALSVVLHNVHGPEFVDRENYSVEAAPTLLEYYRTRGIQLDGNAC